MYRRKPKKDESKQLVKRIKEVVEVHYKNLVIKEYTKQDAPVMDNTMLSQTVVRYYL